MKSGLDEGRSLFLRQPGGMSLANFIRTQLYSTIAPDKSDVEGFAKYIGSYKACLQVERAAVNYLRQMG